MRPAILTLLCGCVVATLLTPRTAWAQYGHGSIVGWGDPTVGVDLSGGFTALVAGEGFSLGLKTDGSIVAWGCNMYGEDDEPVPNTDFMALAAGAHHNLGLKADGSIVAWGSNGRGECNEPVPNTGFMAVAGGAHYSLGIRGCILGDLDCDGDVDLYDLAALLGAYGTCEGDPMYNPDADLDGSGCIDLADLAELLGNCGETC